MTEHREWSRGVYQKKPTGENKKLTLVKAFSQVYFWHDYRMKTLELLCVSLGVSTPSTKEELLANPELMEHLETFFKDALKLQIEEEFKIEFLFEEE